MENKENKNNISFVWLRAVPVLLALFIILNVLSAGPFSKEQATTYKNHFNPAYDFVLEPENKIDVVCIGSSDMFTAYAPPYVFDNYGYTSSNIGISYQNPVKSYTFLLEFLKTQDPKVLILDSDMLYDHFPTVANMEAIEEAEEPSTYQVLRTKQENFFSNYSETRFDDIIGNEFSIFQTNDHWKQWRKFLPKNFISAYTDEVPYPCEHGYKYRKKVVAAKKSKFFIETDKIEEIDYEYKLYYQKIIDLCKEEGIEVIIVEMPTVRSWSTHRHNAVQIIADENGLEYLDLNYHLEELDFNIKKDFFDGKNHLNYSGSKKVSAYLAEYMGEHFDMTDHRDDPEYDFYAQSVEDFKTKNKIK